MNKTHTDFNLIQTDDSNTKLNSLKEINDRRKALAKIGKFSAYAVPASIAIIGNKAVAASAIG